MADSSDNFWGVRGGCGHSAEELAIAARTVASCILIAIILIAVAVCNA